MRLRATVAVVVAAAAGAVATAPGPAGADTIAREQRVYVLGDSYTVQMNGQGLTTSFGADWLVTSAGRGGRNVKVTPPTPSGIQQEWEDQAKIAAVGHVVVQLGTNRGDGSRFIENMKLLVSRIRSHNATAKLYWVDIGHYVECWQKPPSCFDTNAIQRQVAQRNADMNTLAPSLGIEVVNWSKPARAHPEWFAADPSHKHPDATGTRALIALIRSAVQS